MGDHHSIFLDGPFEFHVPPTSVMPNFGEFPTLSMGRDDGAA